MEYMIFGASKKGEMATNSLEGEIVCFVDNDPLKWGTQFRGLTVMSLAESRRRFPYAEIVVASQYSVEIAEQLLNAGVPKFHVFEPKFRSSMEGFNGTPIWTYDLDRRNSNVEDRLALFTRNNSGSNTYALYKSKQLSKMGVDCSLHHAYQPDQKLLDSLIFSPLSVITHDKTLATKSACLQLWHGFPLKGLNYMSRFQPESTCEKTRKRWLQYEAIASYSATYTTLMNACYGVNIDKYHITGMPRNDLLFGDNSRANFEKVTQRDTQGKRLIFYVPTFRKTMYGQVNGEENLTIFGFETLDRDRLFRYLDDNNMILVVKPHPYHEDDFGLGDINELPRQIISFSEAQLQHHSLDFYELLGAADLLITDYSSVYFDFLLLDKPIIFTPSDLKSYELTRGFLLEPYDFWAPGPKVFNQTKLEKCILHQLDTPTDFLAQRESVTSIVHHFRDNESSLRVSKLIGELLNRS